MPAEHYRCRRQRARLQRRSVQQHVQQQGRPRSTRFTGEPPRTALTEPPAGYQTPSPDQPYGLGKEASKPKATDYLTDARHVATVDRQLIAGACEFEFVRACRRPDRARPATIKASRPRTCPTKSLPSFARSPSWLRRWPRSPRLRRETGGPKIADFTLAERARTGRHSRSPRAGRHPHDLVQGRRRRRDAGQIGAGAFPRTPDVQGHRQTSGRQVLASGRPHRRPGKRLHLATTTPAITSACRASSSRP